MRRERYALPPDYNTRMEKEKSRAEKEAEAREARMKAQFPGMFPGPMNMGLGYVHQQGPLCLAHGILAQWLDLLLASYRVFDHRS